MSELSHFAEDGSSRMVDVGAKDITHRTARAEGLVRMKPETLQLICDRKLAKGDVFEVARLAGILAAKKTAELIPLCHPLGLDAVTIDFTIPEKTTGEKSDSRLVRIEAEASLRARTGVEMEAMTAVSVAALTMYDMCKSVDREMRIEQIRLLEKTGGKSGHFQATTP
ncbi:MAG: cyclic pyranopterin monophosphate synthase MoaC [Planctomycetaceae bacterium]